MTKKKFLIIDDNASILDYMYLVINNMGFECEKARSINVAKQLIESNNYDVIISDMNMKDGSGLDVISFCSYKGSDIKIIILTAFGSIDNAVEAMKLGAFDYLEKPIELTDLEKAINHAIASNAKPLNKCLIPKEYVNSEFIFSNQKMKDIMNLVCQIANTDAAVFISGESGTGKEVIARQIHNMSNRKNKPFVAINCAALPEHLVESELFGYDKGAFTGAEKTKLGKFEFAKDGTILLDEITEMNINLQSKILRAIQEKKIERLGSNCIQDINVRIIATTNRNIQEAISNGIFREDLFYRLSIISIDIPPLRERKDDIIPLARKFIELFSHKYDKEVLQLSDEDIVSLTNYRWPGNVRELSNVIERSVILSNEKKKGIFFVENS